MKVNNIYLWALAALSAQGDARTDGSWSYSRHRGREALPGLDITKREDTTFKVVLVGNTKVGKSSILNRYVSDDFSSDYTPTADINTSKSSVQIGGSTFSVNVWDESGSATPASTSDKFYSDASAAVIVYDISNSDSFHDAARWLKNLEDFAPSNIHIYLAGNKNDLTALRQVTVDEAKAYADAESLGFIECSAKDRSNIDLLFQNIVVDLVGADSVIGNGVSLRIMPVGDSITHGYQGGSVNADGNGYRLQLWNRIDHNAKDFVGTQSSGNMADPANEGYNGATISEIASYIQNALPIRPNVVLIHAGTNDMIKPYEPSTASDRLGALIDEVVNACPDATVLVAKIIPISDANGQGRAVTYNAAIEGVIDSRARAGKKVMMVDMSSVLTTNDLIDGLHPTDLGYEKMGDAWYIALKDAGLRGWISAPVQGSAPGTVCSKQPVWYPQGQIASGIGTSKTFTSVWYPKGEIASGVGKSKNVRFGDINGDGRDDYLYVKDDGAIEAYLNTPGSSSEDVVWIFEGTIATGIGKDGTGVQFADLNGDGRDDYLWVSDTGAVICYLNKPGDSAGKPTWIPKGEVASGVGPRERIIFGDVNGDGRDDYLVITDNGGIEAWINSGSGDSVTWMPKGEIASGIGAPAGVRIADMNKDGRDDYIWLSEEGRATLYTNTVGPDPDIPTWWPQGEIATGVGSRRSNIVFADINGDGRSDYLVLNPDSGAVTQWQNGGSGGVAEIGPGITFADLNGDGKDDYLSVSHDGKVVAYINGGTGNNKQIWYPQGEIASGVGAKREQVHFGDMDGDGKVEYLYVHDNGAVESWRNLGSPDQSFPGRVTWYPQGTIATGIGKDGAGVTFADLNGDGRDDYLWVSDTGAVIAYLNGGGDDPGKPVWFPQGTIATGVGAKRSEVRFADLNGDGRVEYLWVQSSGAVQAWYNAGSPEGNNGINGGKVVWVPWGEIASGVGTSGSHIRFGDISGDGRADYLAVTNSNGAVDMWQNGCDGSGTPTTTVPGTVEPTSTGGPSPIPTLVVSCYDSGQSVDRTILLKIAKQFCSSRGFGTYTEDRVDSFTYVYGWDEAENTGVNIIISLGGKSSCASTTITKDECLEDFTKLIDGCDTDSQTKKQGGTMESQCLSYRIDPQADPTIQPPEPCVEAHVYYYNCLLEGTIITAQVWRDGIEVCSGSANDPLGGSNESTYCIDGCSDGYSLCVSEDGEVAEFEDKNIGYTKTLASEEFNSLKSFTCGWMDDDTPLKGSNRETCFWNDSANCGETSSCSLCDYKAVC